jgi:hypothetical protein
MKTLTLIDGEWKERVNSEITEQERNVLKNKDITHEKRKQMIDDMRFRHHTHVSQKEARQAQIIYNNNKLEGAELIEADITLPDGCGIINCRLNGEHKQIRF